MRSDGTEPRKLVSAQDTRGLCWSPDGSTIRFTKDHRLWEVSADGTGLHVLLPAWPSSFWQYGGHWTPDGRFFIFLSRDTLSSNILREHQLWALDERRGLLRRASSTPVQLTSGPIAWGVPILSKDGKKIFTRGVTSRGELVRFDSQTNRLQPYLTGISAEHVSFSPDGKFVAYVTYPEGILWRANRDGSGIQQLTEPPLYSTLPRWSPDGTQILFTGLDAKGRARGYIMSSEGGLPRSLLPDDKFISVSDLGWSPDGRKIVFAAETPDHLIDIRIVDLGGNKITTLPGSDHLLSPRWSPNGQFIAALENTLRDLVVFDFDTQRWSVLHGGETGFPTWSRDGRFIYFLRPLMDPGVFRIHPSGGHAERVIDLNGFRYTGIYQYWMGLDPEDTPMLFRDMGADDIYALTLEEK